MRRQMQQIKAEQEANIENLKKNARVLSTVAIV
jgi:hypothetical protein